MNKDEIINLIQSNLTIQFEGTFNDFVNWKEANNRTNEAFIIIDNTNLIKTY